jgi:PAS domain S-box-containing protein
VNGPQAEALDRLSRLQALTAALSRAITSGEVAEVVLSQGTLALRASAGCVVLLSADRSELVLLRITGAVPDVALKGHRFPVGAPVPLAEAVREQKPVLVETFAERFTRYPTPVGFSPGEGALIALPMVVRDRPIGSLGWGWPTDRTFSDEDKAFVLTVAELCGQALDRAHLFDAECKARERAERAEVAQHEAETRFRAIIDNSPALIFVKDGLGRYVLANLACAALTGGTAEQMVGRTDRDFLPEEYADRFRADDQRVLRTGEVVRYEEQALIGGAVRTFLTVKFPLRDAAGRPDAVCGIATDVTELKRAGEALRENDQRFRAISDNLPFGAVYQVTGDETGARRFLYISAGIERLLGITPDEIRADAMVLYGLVHDADRARVAEAEAVALRDLAPFECEFRSRTQAGGVCWLHCRSAPRRLPTGETIWEGIILDVTDRKRAEEALRHERELLETIIARIPVMLTVYEPDARVLRLNPAFERTVGWSARDAAGVSLMEECYPDPEYRGQVLAFMQSCRDGWMDIRMRTRDERTLETSWANVRLADGTQVGIGLDITDRKRYEDSLRDADRHKDEFLAMLAHELRNPLAPLRNGLQILKLMGTGDAAAERTRQMMERQLGQMVRIIDDLLDLNRVSRGQIALQKQRVALADVVRLAVETSLPLIEAGGHELTVTVPPEPLLVDADPVRLAQVFANLLNNSAKYTDRGGRIWLFAERQGSAVVVSVRDNGIGIPAPMLAKVFDMFTQAEGARDKAPGGLGIGLTLVQRLVALHGGSVEAHSAGPDRGSEFVVRLPLAADLAGVALDCVGAAPAGSVHRILVVDDNLDAATTLAEMLELMGHETRTAHDGLEALAAAAAFRPDLILLDLGMPKLDGYETSRRIRQEPWGARTVLVALTGWGQEEDRRRSRDAGFDEHLVKPVELAALEKLLAGLKTCRGVK